MDLEQKAIERIKTASEMSLHYYGKPLVCTYSGGKDSDVMLELFRRSGVPFEASHGLTTVDAPPTIRHIKQVFQELSDNGIRATIHKPAMSMWQLIPEKKMPPCRMQRYCCEFFKETVTPGRFVATGVRWAESSKRKSRAEIEPAGRRHAQKIMLLSDNDKKRALTESCKNKNEMIVNPIIDWENHDVWDFYWSECKHHNPLYNMGYTRVGCIGCPMAGKHRYKEFRDFPSYERAYKRAFEKMLIEIRKAGKRTKWKTAEDVFRWWMEDDNIPGQMSIDDYLEEKG